MLGYPLVLLNDRPDNMAGAAAAAVNRHGSAGRMEGISRQSRVGPGGAVKVSRTPEEGHWMEV